ncbi:MAG: tetratricopeptide repeat protein [Nitrospinota bacterium]|nr:tetratricopeptide repeat protein [Nitrospinota bacterium]
MTDAKTPEPEIMKSMGRALVLVYVCLALVCVLFIGPASAQDSEEKDPPSAGVSRTTLANSSLAANPELAQALRKWAEALMAGDPQSSVEHSGRILERQAYMGTRNMIPAADLAITIGEKSLEIFNFEGALMAGQLATQVAPDYPAGFFFLGRVRFAMNSKDINSIIPHYINGIKATLLNRLELANFVSDFIKFLFVSLSVTFFIVFLTFLVVHYKALFSELVSFIPGGADDKYKPIIGVMALLAPLALGGVFLFIAVLSILLWPYIRKNEKGIIVLFILLALVPPLAFKQIAKFTILREDTTYRALYLLSIESWDYESKAVIEKAVAKNPKNELFLFSLGNLNKMAKNTDAAVAAYDELLKIHPGNAKAIVNKANAIFQDEILKDKDKKEQNYDESVQIYNQAIAVDPNSVEAYYNLSVAYDAMLQSKKSTAAYESALRLNQQKTKDIAKAAIGAERLEKRVIDFLVSPADLALYEKSIHARVDKLAKGLWGSYFGVLSLNLYRNISLAYLFFFILIALFWERGRIPHQTCISCGAAFHPPMRLEMSTPKCNQCVAAQSSKTVVTSVKKDLKKKEIREFKDKVGVHAGILDRALPGLGRIYTNSPASGLFYTTITSLLLVFGLSAIYFGVLSGSMSPSVLARNNAPALVAMAVYWLSMNTVFYKEH